MPIVHYLPPKDSPPLVLEHSSTRIVVQPPGQVWEEQRVRYVVGEKVFDTDNMKPSGQYEVGTARAWVLSDKTPKEDQNIVELSQEQLDAFKRGKAMNQPTRVVGDKSEVEAKNTKDCFAIVSVTGLVQYLKPEKEVLGDLKKASSLKMRKAKAELEKQEAAIEKMLADKAKEQKLTVAALKKLVKGA
ncbi:MAG: hypothetical protein ACRBI6_04490 [Acidimicrobiales bacterium]